MSGAGVSALLPSNVRGQLAVEHSRLPAMTIQVASDDSGPPDATIPSSDEVLPPTRMSHSKEDAESTGPMPEPDQAASTPSQFPEGGLQAWLTVAGGYAHSLPAEYSA